MKASIPAILLSGVLICAAFSAPLHGSGPIDDKTASQAGGNPFFGPYGTPFDVPPFDRIKTAHFLPAIKEGIRREQAEIDAIANDPQPPTFENTLAAYDHAGLFLSRVRSVFNSLQEADTNEELQELGRVTAPILAAHSDNIGLNEKLFLRIRSVYDRRAGLKLDKEQLFLLENTYRRFVRGGALLKEKDKARLRELNRDLSILTVKFGDNVLAETNAFKLVISDKADLAGLPPSVTARSAQAAKEAGLNGKWLFTIQVPSMTPFLQYSEKRELREKLHRAYCMKGDNDNAADNKETARKIVVLRDEKARLLGYPSHAAYVLENNMAKTPERVNAFLKQLWVPALARARGEAAALQGLIDRNGGGFELASWDWWYYTEKLRREKFDLDDAVLRPYFKLENVREGIFKLCEKLYGLKFIERTDLPRYNPEVQAFEVHEADGSLTGLLYLDFHPRPGKRSGAWSGGFQDAYYENGRRVTPISTITCNFTRPTADAPALLSIYEVETFFHEFGHSLDSLFSQGRYRTRFLAWDSVELPSQIMEHWALEPELLALYARHYKTGEVIPAALVEKLRKSGLFNQGFITTELLAASILDMAWHTLPDPDSVDVRSYEKKVMDDIGLIKEIVPRYRTTYFNHIFSGGYSAGYYAYLWAAVLDCDAYEAFKEKGIFDKATALSFRKNILERLGTEDPMAQYVRFRGAEPGIGPLLRNRGLDTGTN